MISQIRCLAHTKIAIKLMHTIPHNPYYLMYTKYFCKDGNNVHESHPNAFTY